MSFQHVALGSAEPVKPHCMFTWKSVADLFDSCVCSRVPNLRGEKKKKDADKQMFVTLIRFLHNVQDANKQWGSITEKQKIFLINQFAYFQDIKQ